MDENKEKEKLRKKKVKRINDNKKVLNGMFEKLDKDVKESVKPIIDNIAFMKATLEDLQQHINLNGVKEEYQNGANQKGYKKSTEAEMYNSMFKNFNMAINSLVGYLPKKIADNGKDTFDKFVNEIK